MLEDKIKNIALENGASIVGITDILKSDDLTQIESLLENAPSDLNYLKLNIEKRLDIKKWYPDAKSVLLCAWQYWNSSMDYKGVISEIDDYPLFFKQNSRKFPADGLLEFCKTKNIPIKISRYALSRDYHKTIKKKLKAMLKELKTLDDKIDGRFFVDTSPVFEKKLDD